MGLIGVLIGVFSAELNDLVTNLALTDVRGGLDLGVDDASWLRSLYVTGQIVGMSVAPALGIAFSLRRFALFGIALSCISNILFALGGPVPILWGLRFVQGLAEGFIIPLLITVALKLLPPKTRLYGLALYALTATFVPNLAASIVALWVDVVGDWHFLFLEALPLCTVAGLMVWGGLDQEPPQYQRLAKFDWRGLVLLLIGFGCLSTVLEQGDRFDWFNSPAISVAALCSAICVPWFLWNETRVEVPLFEFSLFKRRNFLYAIICLFTFLVINLSASQVPINFLEQIDGYRPAQYYLVTLEIAAAQVILLPATAWLLDQTWADSRVVSAVGFLFILAACIHGLFLNPQWNRDEFMLQQAFQAVGQPLVVMSLLLMATNALKPADAPYASATVNTSRALSEAVGAWLLMLIARLRGGLHQNRLLDEIGQKHVALLQTTHLPAGTVRSLGSGAGASGPVQGLLGAVRLEVATLVTIDTFAALGCLVIFLLILVIVLPQRTYPPRIALAQKS
jgi:DHA2 family multidrug resistance protein